MILQDLPPDTTLFRAHTPQWASRPVSGEGAARKGGRFNRPGVAALYLSLDELTALREYQQTSPFLPPCTMCAYTVTLRDLVDLRQLRRGEPWDELWHDWREDWRFLKLEHSTSSRRPGFLVIWCWPTVTPASSFPVRPMMEASTSWCISIGSRAETRSKSTIPITTCRKINSVGGDDQAHR